VAGSKLARLNSSIGADAGAKDMGNWDRSSSRPGSL
jgi:hypothetical protein